MSRAKYKIQLGKKTDAGSNPEKGHDATLESEDALRRTLEKDTDIIFIVTEVGDEAGIEAAPIISKLAKELGALTIGVTTKLFSFEEIDPKTIKDKIEKFQQQVNSLIIIPNDSLENHSNDKKDILKKTATMLCQAVRSISDLIMVPGLINLSIEDIKAAMGEGGLSMMGLGVATGDSRAKEATKRAITSLPFEGINNASNLIMNATVSHDTTMAEIADAMKVIQEPMHENAAIFMGVVFDGTIGDEMRITVITAGQITP